VLAGKHLSLCGQRPASPEHTKSRQERTGQVLYGWRAGAGGKLEAEPAGQAVFRRIRKMRASTRAIAARLNAEGVPARGSRWHQTTMVRLLGRTAPARRA
jgi:hypothetical protein